MNKAVFITNPKEYFMKNLIFLLTAILPLVGISQNLHADLFAGIATYQGDLQGKYFTIKGYDKSAPYFTVLAPVHRVGDSSLSVGGKSKEFLTWTAGSFYQSGQIVFYKKRVL